MAGAEVRVQPPRLLGAYREMLTPALQRAVEGVDPELGVLLRYHMGWADPSGRPLQGDQGKALRPTLCLFACEGVGSPPQRALPAAVAVECIHNFSLVHDDIQDEDRERRHRPTVWAVWGVPKALTAGNALRAIADRALLGLLGNGVPAAVALEAAWTLTEAYLEMIEGQTLDISYEGRPDITVDDYLRMVSKKTAALIGASLAVGALVGGAPPPAVQALREAGRLLGLGFQVQDDVLGIWGDRAITGKAVGADILRRKTSFPIVYALERAPAPLAQRLRLCYQRGAMTEADVPRVLEVLEAVDARRHAQEAALAYCREGVRRAGQVLPPWATEALEELARFIVYRQG
jgi:geranylgeranyl diphosphate synthase type I